LDDFLEYQSLAIVFRIENPVVLQLIPMKCDPEHDSQMDNFVFKEVSGKSRRGRSYM
jgi:hypothetical protein